MFKSKYYSIFQEIYEYFSRAPEEVIDRNDMYEIINKLLRLYNFNKDCKTLNPITIEIAMGNFQAVTNIIDNDNDINKINEIGMTPLTTAIYFNNYYLTDFFINKGADVNFQYKNGSTILMLACDRHNSDILDLLLKDGANVKQLDSNGYNMLHHILNCGCARDLISDTHSFIELDMAFSNKVIELNNSTESRLNCIDLLLKNGIDINYCNELNGINALSLALEGNGSFYSKAIDKLIKNGAEKRVVEINPGMIYLYQDDFDFINDIKDLDISCWADAPSEFLCYLEYRRRIAKYKIEVYSEHLDDGYRRSKKVVKRLVK